MLLGRVAGTLVASHKEPFDGRHEVPLCFARWTWTTMTLPPMWLQLTLLVPESGEVVMYAQGSSARQTELTHERPCDAVVMAIVDEWEVDGATKYRK